MTRKGRKPVGWGHLDQVASSQLARDRLLAILKTLEGSWTIPEACKFLGICESRFHQVRQTWLGQAVELLEPRPLGRPRSSGEPPELAALSERAAALERALALLQTRLEVAELVGGSPAEKKGASRKS